MKLKILIPILGLVLFSALVFAQIQPQAGGQALTDQKYDALEQQLLSQMTDQQKQQYQALTPQQQRQFIEQQVALANLRWQSQITVDCGGRCVEGLPAVWQVKLGNTGQSSFQLDSVALIDSAGNVFAQKNASATVPVNQQATINLQGIVPPPTRSSTLYYRAVFVIDGNVQQEQGNRRLTVMPFSEVECTDNTTCPEGTFCGGYECMPYSALPENKSAPPQNIFSSDSVFYPIVIIVLLLVIIALLISKGKPKKLPKASKKSGAAKESGIQKY